MADATNSPKLDVITTADYNWGDVGSPSVFPTFDPANTVYTFNPVSTGTISVHNEYTTLHSLITSKPSSLPGNEKASIVLSGYETGASISDCGVVALENGSDYASLSITYTPDSAPTGISLTSNTIAENQAAGTTIGTLSTTDTDIAAYGDSHIYTLGGRTQAVSLLMEVR